MGLCKNCGEPSYGAAPRLELPVKTNVNGDYCSVKCIKESVNSYFSEQGPAQTEENCPPEMAKKIISVIEEKLIEESWIPSKPFLERTKEITTI